MAEPSTTPWGSVPSDDVTDIQRPEGVCTRASGPEPPAENSTGLGDPAGAHVPAGPLVNAVATSTHPAPRSFDPLRCEAQLSVDVSLFVRYKARSQSGPGTRERCEAVRDDPQDLPAPDAPPGRI